jgi:thiol-disulfide isomerase/thioredoxin
MGESAPNFDMTLLHRGEVKDTNLTNMRGKPVVLEFWATWCTGCQQFTPSLNQLHARYGDRVNFVAVSAEPIDLLKQDATKTGKTFPVAHDPNEFGHDEFFIRSYPTFIIIDQQHKVRKILSGPMRPGDLEAAIKAVSP